jgi:hypothetical protein
LLVAAEFKVTSSCAIASETLAPDELELAAELDDTPPAALEGLVRRVECRVLEMDEIAMMACSIRRLTRAIRPEHNPHLGHVGLPH